MLINQFLEVAAQQSIDGKKFKLDGVQHRPYANTAEVLSAIKATRRHIGQEFAVANGAAVETWHFVGGIADVNLVKKDTGNGSAWNYRGEYDPLTEYGPNDVVLFQGSSFISLDNNTGVTPAHGAEWGLLATSPIAVGQSGNTLYSSGIAGTGQGDPTNKSDVFLGVNTGSNTKDVTSSNFIGSNAGNEASDLTASNFIGLHAGYKASGASYSNLIGRKAGYAFAGNNIGKNNIIIGQNISLPNGAEDSINIGGVLFGKGAYKTITGNPAITPSAEGRIGIGVVNPTEKLEVGGNVKADKFIGSGEGLTGIKTVGGESIIGEGDIPVGSAIINVTKTEADTLIANSKLEVGALYRISGFHVGGYNDGTSSGTTVILRAVADNIFAEDGYGEFWNPKFDTYWVWENKALISPSNIVGNFAYNEAVTANNGAKAVLWLGIKSPVLRSLTGDWSTATSITGDSSGATANIAITSLPNYSTGNKVQWGAYVWENVNGNVGAMVDGSTLNAEWSKVAYNDTDYDFVIDRVKVSWQENYIRGRYDNLGNEYEFGMHDLTVVDTFPAGVFPLERFPFGYSGYTDNKITNSFFDWGNARIGMKGNTLINFSVIDVSYRNGTSNYYPLQYSVRISGNRLDSGIIKNNKLGENAYISKNTFAQQAQISNVVPVVSTDKAAIENNDLDLLYIAGNYLDGRSWISGNKVTNWNQYGSSITHNRLTLSSRIINNTIIQEGGYVVHIRFNELDYYSRIEDNIFNSKGGASAIELNKFKSSKLKDSVFSMGSFAKNNVNYTSLLGLNVTGSGPGNGNIYDSVFEGSDWSASSYYYPALQNITVLNTNINNLSIKHATIQNLNVSRDIDGIKVEGWLPANTKPVYNFGNAALNNSISFSVVKPKRMVLPLSVAFDGTSGRGAVGVVSVSSFPIPSGFFISSVKVKGSGLTSAGAAKINLGIATDAPNGGLDDTTGDITNLSGIKIITPTSPIASTATRSLVMTVKDADITAGTLSLEVELVKL